MIIDYTEIFTSPDELADYLMLPVEKQDRILFGLAVEGNMQAITMACCATHCTPS